MWLTIISSNPKAKVHWARTNKTKYVKYIIILQILNNTHINSLANHNIYKHNTANPPVLQNCLYIYILN